jgi:hypothetical protein
MQKEKITESSVKKDPNPGTERSLSPLTPYESRLAAGVSGGLTAENE